MQVCSIDLRLGGSLNHTISKNNVTPAEIVILKAIHGEDAVVNIRPIKMDGRRNDVELDRLQRLYGRNPSGLMDAGNGDLIEKLFPGAVKKLPIRLKDIGLGDLMYPLRAPAEPVEKHDEQITDENGEPIQFGPIEDDQPAEGDKDESESGNDSESDA